MSLTRLWTDLEGWSPLAIGIVPCAIALALLAGLSARRLFPRATLAHWALGGTALGLVVAAEARDYAPPSWLAPSALGSVLLTVLVLCARPQCAAVLRWLAKAMVLLLKLLAALVALVLAAAAVGGFVWLMRDLPARAGAVGLAAGLWLAALPALTRWGRRAAVPLLVLGALAGVAAGLEVERRGVDLHHVWWPAVGGIAAVSLLVALRRRRTTWLQLLGAGLAGTCAGMASLPEPWRWIGAFGFVPALVLVTPRLKLDPGTDQAKLAGHPRRWWTLAALALSLVLITADNTIFNVALPDMRDDLGATASQMSWIVDAYLLFFAGFQLTLASVGDRFGRRRALLIGLVVFSAGSLAAVFATDPLMLVVARAVMGIGGAFALPTTLSTLKVVFREDEQGKVTGVWAAVSGVGVAVGPVIGGYLVEDLGWRSVFFVGIPLAAAGFIAALRLVPESRDPDATKLDLPGAALSIAGVGTLIWAITEAPSHGWGSRSILWAFGIAAAVLALFAVRELTTKNPMLDLRLLRKPVFLAAAGAIGLVFFGLMGALYLLAQHLQVVLGYSALKAGTGMLPVAPGIALMSLASPWLVKRLRTGPTVALGLLIIAGAMWLLSTVSADSGYLLVGVSIGIAGMGMGTAIAPSTASVMNALAGRAAVGSAMNEAVREFGATFGVAILATVLSTVFADRMAGPAAGLPAAQHDLATDSVGAAYTLAGRLHDPALQAAAHRAFVDGMSAALHVGAGVALIGALVALLFLPGLNLRRRKPVAVVEAAVEELKETVGEVTDDLLEIVSETPPSPTERRPLLRGWLHVAGALASVPAGIWLVASTQGDLARWAALVFVVGQVAVFGVSALNHVVGWPSVAWQKADHATVFFGIACGYTPLGLLAPAGSVARDLLIPVWIVAGLGVLMKVLWIGSPAWLGLSLYGSLGWAPGVIAVVALRDVAGLQVVALVLGSGVVYTLGALVYATRRIDPWPRVFGFHEVWHTATLVASALQWLAVAGRVLPAMTRT